MYKCRSMLMLRIDLYFFAQKEKYYNGPGNLDHEFYI